MFDSIIERAYSYQKIISTYSRSTFNKSIYYLRNLNTFLKLKLKGLKYNYNLRRKYYSLGKYLSSLNNSSYNLHEDEIFLNYIKEIKLEKEYIKDNNYELSILFNKKGIQI